jgi:hypothetical protein
MTFSRAIAPVANPDRATLTRMMAGIGINVAAEPLADANIEDTLYFAAIEGMERPDLRTLSLLTQWLEIHASRVNADRLARLVMQCASGPARVYWSAVARWLEKDRRFARMAGVCVGPRIPLLLAGTGFQVSRRGEDPRFAGGPLIVPGGVLRARPGDILPPAELARRHRTYWWRVLLGPTYRADMMAAFEASPDLSAADLARACYGSFATAHAVRRDWATLARPT